MADLASLHLVALYGAAFLNAAMPGPGALAVHRTARLGVPSGLRVSLGVVMGMFATLICALCAMLGVLTLSQTLFEVTRWAGIGVLVLLGPAMLLPRRGMPTAQPLRADASGSLVAGLLVGRHESDPHGVPARAAAAVRRPGAGAPVRVVLGLVAYSQAAPRVCLPASPLVRRRMATPPAGPAGWTSRPEVPCLPSLPWRWQRRERPETSRSRILSVADLLATRLTW